MSTKNTHARGPRARRRTWVAGGALLLLSVAVGIAARGQLASFAPAKDWVFAAAMILLVVGMGRAGSLTARRIVGTAAAILLVTVPLTQSYWFSFIPDSTEDPHLAEDVGAFIAFTYHGIMAILAVITVVEIARAKVIPSPWRWAPLWVAVLTPITYAIGLTLFSSAPLGTTLASTGAIVAGYGPAVGIALLGVLGIALGMREKATRDDAPAEFG
ncbi:MULTISPECIES: hypothetical protein [unclassified Microbacterium]|uniref:hypothetical protein n=1 Tax=unclassified Microbacterium TaxID=2609290 RepID=UPI0011C3BF69|nr:MULTISPECIES: hypothetical protein [unclassified Microbacterium]MBT2485922.1 hypothetical protein [Microbacterium sp. ISL-108]